MTVLTKAMLPAHASFHQMWTNGDSLDHYHALNPAERNLVAGADRLLFCAKEATYKAWYPLTGRWLGFEDADIDLRPDGTFVSYILVRPTPVHFIEGHWTVENGYVIATAVVR